jgi:hypothetical protein
MPDEKDPQVVALENCILQLALSAQKKGSENVSAAIEGVRVLGFDNLDQEIRDELLAMADYYGWGDGPEYFGRMTKEG